jgi:hypothetical protein
MSVNLDPLAGATPQEVYAWLDGRRIFRRFRFSERAKLQMRLWILNGRCERENLSDVSDTVQVKANDDDGGTTE